MRAVLQALTDELKRLKAAGVKNVAVSDASVAALRRAVSARRDTGSAIPDTGKPGPRAESTERAAPNPPSSTIRNPQSEIPNEPPLVTLPDGDKAVRWAALRELVLNHPVCRAHVPAGRQVVFGVGSVEAKIMFVGEAPGEEEELQGEPFVGPAGQLLTRMIKGMGLERSDVYIGNIMNWRPETTRRAGGVQFGNREPSPAEMAFCLPFLLAQIEVVAPTLLVALGATAARGLLGAHSFRALGEVRGRWHDYRGRPLRVTYHPSYLLRKEAEGKVSATKAKRAAWEDLLAVMERAGLPVSEKQRNYYRA